MKTSGPKNNDIEPEISGIPEIPEAPPSSEMPEPDPIEPENDSFWDKLSEKYLKKYMLQERRWTISEITKYEANETPPAIEPVGLGRGEIFKMLKSGLILAMFIIPLLASYGNRLMEMLKKLFG